MQLTFWACNVSVLKWKFSILAYFPLEFLLRYNAKQLTLALTVTFILMTQTYCSSNQVIQYKKWFKKAKQVWKLPYISATHTYMTETVTGWTNSISACPKPWVWNSFLSLVWMCHSVIGRNLFAFSSTLQQLLTDFRLTEGGSICCAALRQTHRCLDKDRLSACVCAESEKKNENYLPRGSLTRLSAKNTSHVCRATRNAYFKQKH